MRASPRTNPWIEEPNSPLDVEAGRRITGHGDALSSASSSPSASAVPLLKLGSRNQGNLRPSNSGSNLKFNHSSRATQSSSGVVLDAERATQNGTAQPALPRGASPVQQAPRQSPALKQQGQEPEAQEGGQQTAAAEAEAPGGGEEGPPKRKLLTWSQKIDAFALKEKPSTVVGGVITVLVVCAVIAYTVYTVTAWVNRPFTKNAQSQWTYRSGPWPMHLRCRAASGCYVSNHFSPQWADMALDPTQDVCTYMNPGDWVVVPMVFSNNPNEGLGIIFIPGPSTSAVLPPTSTPNTTVPSGFGFEIESLVVSVTSPDGVEFLETPVASGLNLIFLVETTNNSAISAAGAFRREWYPTQIANLNNAADVAIVPTATTCNVSAFNSSWVHSRVRLNAEYVQLVVDRDALWLVVWGAVGGAMGLFMQVGGFVLGATSVVMQVMNKRRQVRDGSLRLTASPSTAK